MRTATASHSAGKTEAVSLPGNLTSGDHTVTVDFLNDAYGGAPSMDRNLYVDGITLGGSPTANGAAALPYQGPVSFDVVLSTGSAADASSAGMGGAPSSTATTASSTSTGASSTPVGPSQQTGTSGATNSPSATGSSSPSGTTSTPPSGLVVDISEDAWQGDAQYTISVDGQQVGGVRTATASHSAGKTEAVSLPGNLTSGDHTVTVDFLNDAYGGAPSMDRNLYVDGITLGGSPTANGAAALPYQGPVSFDVVLSTGSAADASSAGMGGAPSSTATTASSTSTGASSTPVGPSQQTGTSGATNSPSATGSSSPSGTSSTSTVPAAAPGTTTVRSG